MKLYPSAARVAFALCCVVGCRFGGPTGNPAQPIDLARDAGKSDGGRRDAGVGSAAASSSDASGSPGTTPLARDASVGDAQVKPGPFDDAGPDAQACDPPGTPPPVCDPMQNTGCGIGMQCDVDLFAPGLAGRCTFSAPIDAGGCFSPIVTTSCPPKQTCQANACRTICLCDSDCAAHECCSEVLGTQGWKLCSPCP